MSDGTENQAFSQELKRRFDELMQWAIENWPEKGRPLTAADFARVRQELDNLGMAHDETLRETREPAAGGEQYLSINPAPWP